MAQFLTLPNGSLPPNTNLAALQAAGVKITRPTQPPPAQSGKIAVDTADPELVDGVYYQRWAIVDDPNVLPPVRQVTPLEFLNRLPVQTLAAVLTAVQSDPLGRVWLAKLQSASVVDLDSVETVQGLQYLLAVGVLSQSDYASLLA